MIKKASLILLLIAILSSGSLFAHAIGIMGGGSNDAVNAGAALTGKFDPIPLMFGLSIAEAGGTYNLGLSADYWFHEQNLVNFVNLYVGVGAGLGISLGENANLSAGLRVPVGVNAFPIDPLELFIELVPTIGANMDPFKFPTFALGWGGGIRFWF